MYPKRCQVNYCAANALLDHASTFGSRGMLPEARDLSVLHSYARETSRGTLKMVCFYLESHLPLDYQLMCAPECRRIWSSKTLKALKAKKVNEIPRDATIHPKKRAEEFGFKGVSIDWQGATPCRFIAVNWGPWGADTQIGLCEHALWAILSARACGSLSLRSRWSSGHK